MKVLYEVRSSPDLSRTILKQRIDPVAIGACDAVRHGPSTGGGQGSHDDAGLPPCIGQLLAPDRNILAECVPQA